MRPLLDLAAALVSVVALYSVSFMFAAAALDWAWPW